MTLLDNHVVAIASGGSISITTCSLIARRSGAAMTGQMIVADEGLFHRAVIGNGVVDRVGR